MTKGYKMGKKEIKKTASRAPSKKIAKKKPTKKTPQKTKIEGGKKKKPVKIKTLKKLSAEKKVAAKVRVVKKIQTVKKVQTPKKSKTVARVKVAKVVKSPKKVLIQSKVKSQKPATLVLHDKKAEEQRRIALRNSLVRKREEIVKEAKSEISKYIRGETRQLVDTALDNGDWSVVDLSEDISLRQLSTHRETLLKIDEALRKIDEGTYGKCEDCGEDISVERLKILPFAIYCVECQEKKEQLAVLERGERIVE
jgi:DnaK suppressor protein